MKYANAACQIIGYVSTMWKECCQPTVIPLLSEGIFQQLKVREVSTFHGGRQLVLIYLSLYGALINTVKCGISSFSDGAVIRLRL